MAVIAYMIGENRVLIDEEFLPLMREYRWHPDKHKYIVAGIRGGVKELEWIKLHRVIMGAKEGEHVDHINSNPLDNRRSNLRNCTQAQNLMNSSSRKNSSSKFKGVSICKRSGGRLWIAQIKKDKTSSKYIGRFESEELAAKAYDEAAKLQCGEFAKLNFPEKIEEEIIISATHYHVDFKSMTASKYIGVNFDKRSPKTPWAARVHANKKAISLKLHATEEEAARAHDKKSWEIFRDPKKLNFPEEYLNDDSF